MAVSVLGNVPQEHSGTRSAILYVACSLVSELVSARVYLISGHNI